MTRQTTIARVPGTLAVLLLTVCVQTTAVAGDSHVEPDALQSMAFELSLQDGNLKVINLYKKQALILRELAGAPDDQVVARMVREIYDPYKPFWAKYCCKNEETFAHVARTTREGLEKRLQERLPELMQIDLNALFEGAASKLHGMTGRTAKGTWYLVFSVGMTDLGGVGGSDMIIDFTHPETELKDLIVLMPHELTHQIMGAAKSDPDSGTVLARILSEGFATYAGYRFFGEEHTEAENLLYTEDEWQWALENEKRIFAEARKYLYSTAKADENRFGLRDIQLIEGGPGAIGYFIGFRIVQAYVARHGSDSWVDLFDLSLKDTLAESGYNP